MSALATLAAPVAARAAVRLVPDLPPLPSTPTQLALAHDDAQRSVARARTLGTVAAVGAAVAGFWAVLAYARRDPSPPRSRR